MKYVQLKEIVEIVRGVTFSKDEGTDQADENRYPVIRAGSIQNELLVNEDQIWVLKEKIKQNQLIRKNDIIMCTSSGSAELVGKCAISSCDVNVSFGAFCVGLRPIKNKVIPSFIYHYLRTPAFRNWSKNAGGANIKNLRVSELADFEIPLPPLVEQKRIAAILDKADAIRQKRQQAIALADQFLRSVFLDMFGDPVTNPKGWPLTKCQNIFERITVGIVVKPSSYYVEVGVPALRSQNIKEYGIEKNNFVYISEVDNENTLSKSRVFEGDVVIVRTGQPGKTAVVTKEFDGVNAIDILIATPKSTDLNADYFSFFMNSAGGINLVSAEKRGQVQQHFNVGSLNHAFLPLPPLELQVKFIKVLHQIKKKYFSERTHDYDELFNSLSQKAFSGQL